MSHPKGDTCYEISRDKTVRAAFAQGYDTGYAHGKDEAAPLPPAGDLPERMDVPSRDEYELECYWAAAVEQAKAHNDCLDACAPIVTRLQAENAALQQRLNEADQRVDDLERKAKLYDQLQRGAELLPEGWMITVEIERDGGGVTLIDPQGNDLDYPSNRESMGDEVEDAIEEALAQQVES